MEQQKITKNLLLNSQSHLNIADISNTYQKTLRSLHNISNSNIKSKSKLGSGPQVVISYNFQNDLNCQVRTHNLLIGLNEDLEPHSKKNTFRKNVILRSNNISNSNSYLRNSRNQSQHMRHKLIHVRSNEILSTKHQHANTTFQSFYTKNSNAKNYPKSFIHGNTFWKDERNSFDKGKQINEKNIIKNVDKIAQRRSENKTKSNLNVYSNSIQKISRSKLNAIERIGEKDNLAAKLKQNLKYELHDPDILERDQTSRLTKRSNKEDDYNQKLQHILKKVKREKIRSKLKQAYTKQQPNFTSQQILKLSNLHSKVKLSPGKMSPKSRTIHEDEVQKLTSFIGNHKPESQPETGYYEKDQKTSFDPYNPLTNFQSLSQLDPASKSILNYQRGVIERENTQKPKRKYHQLIKNANKKYKNSLAEEFHRIESENQNEMGSSKKGTEDKIPANNLAQKSFDYSINGHLNQNVKNIKQTHGNVPSSNNQSVIIQKLELNKKESNKSTKNQHLKHPSSTHRNNYHTSTAYERNPNQNIKDRKRLNSNIDHKSHTFSNEKEEGATKRKVPADYKEFLRMLSEENERRRQIQQMQRERQLSLNAQKTSRFQNIEEQNQHIKRILAPIGNSFMDQRRKRLSDERKSKRKLRKQQRLENADGSIIESDSQSSSDVGRKSHRRKQLKKKLKNRSLQSKTNSQAESKYQTRDFRESLKNSIEKIKKESNNNSPKKQKLGQNQSNFDQKKLKAKMNSSEFQSQDNFTEDKESSEDNNLSEKQHRGIEKIQKLTGIKIPQKAIERAKSKRLFKRSDEQNSNRKNQKIMNQKSGINEKVREAKITQQGNKTLNKFLKNKNASKSGKISNEQKQSQEINKEKGSKLKDSQDKKIKPIDKRVAQDKQRKFKNWNENEKTQKQQKQQGPHSKKDQNINQKDWKEAQKVEKYKKGRKIEKKNDDGEQEMQASDNDLNKTTKRQQKKQKKEKKVIINENGESREMQNSDEQQTEQQTENLDEKEEKYSFEKIQENQDEKDNRESGNIEFGGNEIVKQEMKGLTKQSDKNQSLPKIQKKELVPSIHENVEIPNKNQKRNQKADFKGHKEKQNRESQFAVVSNKPSIQSALGSGKIQNSPSSNLLQENEYQNVQNNLQRQSSGSNNTENISKHTAQEKKQEIIQNVIDNNEMKQNGFMQISESKFDIYNHESDKSVAENALQQIQQMDSEELEKRAEIVKFLYSLPSEYQQEVNKFLPNQTSDRLLSSNSFTKKNANTFKNIKIQGLRSALQELTMFDNLNPKLLENKLKIKSEKIPKSNFLKKIFEPYQSLNGQIGIWMFCIGVWRLITVHQNEIEINQNQSHYESLLFQCLEKAFQIAVKTYYSGLKMNEVKHEEILRMLTGLRISSLVKSKGKAEKIFRQIEYNSRKNHIIRAISSSESKFTKETINCVRKIQNTPTGQKVLQIVSTSMNQIQLKPKYFWIREDKFLEFFNSFTIISRRNTDSYWTNDSIKIRNQQKAVYMIDSTQKHTSGSISLYPLDRDFSSNKQKCTIAFYKEIEPQVLKLVGKAMERLPESKELIHTSKLYFEFNIKGTYYVFLELEDGLYNVAIESNNPQMKLNFVEYVKKETNKNQQCEYVEIDKIFKKKPNINTLQSSNEFKQLLNFMKKTSPQIYQAK